jgi:cyclic pyranopterin phosphate synthase
MVDVGAKPVSVRSATAQACVRFPPGILPAVMARGGPKGPVLEVARAAGLLAAKRTAELIPMCHSLALDHIDLSFEQRGDERLVILVRTSCQGRTGVEMEAMVGAAVAALCIYDMTKGLERGICIEGIQLLEKRGGKSGTWRAPEGVPPPPGTEA